MPETSEYYQPELTLPDLLTRAISIHPDLFTGYYDKDGSLKIQTYEDLLTGAEHIATGLYNLGLRQGDKIIIAVQDNQQIIELLWGSFLLGIVPTVLQPPMTFSGYNPAVVKLVNVHEQLDYPYIIMSEGVKVQGIFPEGKTKHKEELDFTGVYDKPILNPDDLAFIQFSSGSTGNPKGIMLSHRNIMVNLDAIRIAIDIQSSDRFGNWMPLFHDMGLIGTHIVPIYCIIAQYHIDTIDFIMKPGLWLNLMSQEKVTLSGCTNFGLALVLRYLKRNKLLFDWDFSSLKALMNGAEPISVKIMQEFVDTLELSGFRPEAMMPVYGMAEATLAISFAPLMERSVIKAFNTSILDRENKAQPVDPSEPTARLLSEVGVRLNDIEIRIVDDNDQVVMDGNSGHIQIKGPSITKGYYNNRGATIPAYCEEWFRTGDIGFFFEGRLYISGRYKDIIFKNGRNYFANDLEEIASTLDEIKYGKVCFCGTTSRETGQDKVIVFAASLPEEKASETFHKLRGLLRSNLGITVDEMVLIKSNEIPKTSSGKLQRFKLMQRYINGEFDNKRIRAEA